MSERPKVSILGVGNLGRALATGWVRAQLFTAAEITLTRRDSAKLEDLAQSGHPVGSDNTTAVSASDVLVLAVQPQQLQALLEEIRPVLDGGRHRVISVVSGVSIRQIRDALGANVPVVRAMPNTAVSIGESMTCLCSDGAALAEATELFRSRRPNARDRRADDGASHRTVRLRCGVFPPVRACSLTGGHRDWLSPGGGAATRGPDRQRRRRARPQAGFTPRGRNRPGYDAAGLHHRRPERDGASRSQLGNDPRHYCVGKGGGGAVLFERLRIYWVPHSR
mgnify:CR=1 FL=1